MAGDAEPLLGPARLREVRDFWLEHLAGPDALVLPSQADHARWFAGGEELDRACVYVAHSPAPLCSAAS